jgi:hypothetical protein
VARALVVPLGVHHWTGSCHVCPYELIEEVIYNQSKGSLAKRSILVSVCREKAEPLRLQVASDPCRSVFRAKNVAFTE